MKALKVVLSVIFIAGLLFTCNKDEGDDIEVMEVSEIPSCILEIIDAENSMQIHRQDINGETHYWLNTGANAYDGDEQIVNDACEEVCFYGGWINPECTEDYIPDDWEQIFP